MNSISKIARNSILFISIFLIFEILNVNKVSEAAETHRVLFISSYNGAFETYPELMKGLTNIFYEEGILFDIEFMDTKRFNTEENYNNYYQFLKYRLDNSIPYDLIMVSDDNGLQFLMDYKEALVGDIPVIYFAINEFSRVVEAGKIPTFTGVYEGASIKENLELAMQLQPDADTFYVLVDDTATGQGDVHAFLSLEDTFSDMHFEVLDFSLYSLEAFEERLKQFTSKDVLIYMTMFNDREGNSYSIPESIKILTEYVDIPIYRPTIGGVGDGLLGGYMLSYSEQAKMAAEIAVKVLHGTSIESIPIVTESPNKYIIDYEVMQKFSLDMDVLPKGTEIINKPITFIENYEKLILPFLIILVIVLVIFVLMYLENRKNYQHSKELSVKNDELSALYEELTASEEELRSQYEELSESREQLLQGEKRLTELAYHDHLTGLYNRSALFMRLDDILKKGYFEGELYYIDLDHFKYVNDTGGHKLGDGILENIGRRFKEWNLANSLVSRVGGDEFVVVHYWNKGGALHRKKMYHKINAIIEEPIIVKEEAFHMSCSIGVVNFPCHGTGVDELIRKADIAMYKAKEKGRKRIAVYSDFMETESTNILSIQNSIYKAIDEKQFELFLQPQIDMKTENVIAFEGLIRWKHPEKGWISPLEFIPIAEQLGLIHNIGRWVYNQACWDLKKLIANEFMNMKIAVNVSAVELTRIGFETEFIDLLAEYDLDVDSIAIELTESVFMESTESHLKKLETLRKAGIKLHLDDFGTGYSSLKYLMNLPIDSVKIDREFIKNIHGNERMKKLLANIIKTIRDLDMKVIAEGVETKEHHEILKALGCDMAQGYYYAKPMCFEEVLKLLHKQKDKSFDVLQ